LLVAETVVSFPHCDVRLARPDEFWNANGNDCLPALRERHLQLKQKDRFDEMVPEFVRPGAIVTISHDPAPVFRDGNATQVFDGK
jgi:hypothetical protein